MRYILLINPWDSNISDIIFKVMNIITITEINWMPFYLRQKLHFLVQCDSSVIFNAWFIFTFFTHIFCKLFCCEVTFIFLIQNFKCFHYLVFWCWFVSTKRILGYWYIKLSYTSLKLHTGNSVFAQNSPNLIYWFPIKLIRSTSTITPPDW